MKKVISSVLVAVFVASVMLVDADRADAAVRRGTPTGDCLSGVIAVEPGLIKNVYYSENYLIHYQLQKWTGSTWVTVHQDKKKPPVGWEVRVSMFGRSSGWYKVRAGIVWWDHGTVDYGHWGYGDVSHMGPNKDWRGNFCYYG